MLDLPSNTSSTFQSAMGISGIFFKDRIVMYVVNSNEIELPFHAPGVKYQLTRHHCWLFGLMDYQYSHWKFWPVCFMIIVEP